MKKIILLILIPFISLLNQLFVEQSLADECIDCVERKKQMCSSECELVDSKSALNCQKDCIIQYCTHKCDAKHEALNNILEASCEKCQDEQYNLCDCPTGSDRNRALCKISCAEKKCSSVCE